MALKLSRFKLTGLSHIGGNAIPVLHHRPFLFGFILCVTFVTRSSCFLTVSVELYELMNL